LSQFDHRFQEKRLKARIRSDYVKTLVMPTLERWKREGAVGVKFGLAYRRSLSFAEVGEDEAASIYRKYARVGTGPPAAEHKAVQDYLFRLVVREAGQRGLVVFVHTGVGAADYFNISGSNPALLEPIMFGTDAYSEPDTPLANWEEKTWVATRAAREALASP
jgi:hypothetical protein